MAFTTINIGDAVSETLGQVLLELKTALNEREAAFSITVSSTWDTSGRIEVMASYYIETLRTKIALLLAEHDDTAFMKADGLTQYADEDDLLDEAGYPSGWIDMAGSAISDRDIWIQFQDVFSVLKKIRKIKSGSGEFSVIQVRPSSGSGTDEAQWDEAVAGTYATYVSESAQSVKWKNATYPLVAWTLYGPQEHTYDTSGWPEELGTLEYARHAYYIDAIPNGDTSGQMDVSLNSGEETITVEMDESADGAGEIDLVEGFVFGSDYTATAESVDPANQPYSKLAGKEPRFFFNANGTGSGDKNVPVTFLFDITSAMTYG